MVFLVVPYHCESWTINKSECQITECLQLWCWKRLLKVPWTARRSNQSIIREINPEYSLEGLMLKLKLQYFGHLMRIDNSLGRSTVLGNTEERKRREHQRMRQLDDITENEHELGQTLGDSEGQGSLVCCISWSRKE